MSSMRPPMFAGPMDRHVKLRRRGSSDLWTGSAGGAGCWNPWAVSARTPYAHSSSAVSAANRRFIVAPSPDLKARPYVLNLLLEIDLRGGGRRRGHLEVRILLEAEHLRRHVAGKRRV